MCFASIKTFNVDRHNLYQSHRLQQALHRAHDSLSGPGPDRPFTPTFEQLRIADKAKDIEISERIRFNVSVCLSLLSFGSDFESATN
jgi:hypothetical protein